MATCTKCGKETPNGETICPECAAQEAQKKADAAKSNPQNDLSAKLAGLNNTADSTADFDSTDVANNKVMGVLAYLSWLVLIPIFGAKNSKFARFHANQGILLAIAEIVWWVASGILTSILYAIAWQLGSIVSVILNLVNILFFVMSILGIVNAASGKAKELPIIGKYKILK